MQSCSSDLVLIKGAGDLASGVAARLHWSGFAVVMTELAQPMMVRRSVSFGEAVYDGQMIVEGITAKLAEDLPAARESLERGIIPVIVDPHGACLRGLAPAVVVDAVMAKSNTGTSCDDAPLVIALGPGFTAGVDCHAVIETNRGHWLGRVMWNGSAEPDTRIPGLVRDKQSERVLRAPAEGTFWAVCAIGDRVEQGQLVARVGNEPLLAAFAGIVRGLIRDGVHVAADLKVGDIDPRGEIDYCYYISEKSLAIGGAVLEAILTWRNGVETRRTLPDRVKS